MLFRSGFNICAQNYDCNGWLLFYDLFIEILYKLHPNDFYQKVHLVDESGKGTIWFSKNTAMITHRSMSRIPNTDIIYRRRRNSFRMSKAIEIMLNNLKEDKAALRFLVKIVV